MGATDSVPIDDYQPSYELCSPESKFNNTALDDFDCNFPQEHSPFERISHLLERYYVTAATYDYQGAKGCPEGTHVAALAAIDQWIQDAEAKPIFWLAGEAGTGKTSIALTVCQRVRADGNRLGGTFFYPHSFGRTQRDARRIVPTLVLQLAHQSERFATALATKLRDGPDVLRMDISSQVDMLLDHPLSVLKSSGRPVVFVIDVGELGGQWPENRNDLEGRFVLSELFHALHMLFFLRFDELLVKFLVCSRPDEYARESLNGDPDLRAAFRLYTID